MSARSSLHYSSRSESHSSGQNDEDFFTYDAAGRNNSQTSSTPLEPTVFGVYDPRRTSIAEQPVNPKVAIPRLEIPLAFNNGRVSRACHNCRKQKNKCSGHRPACLRCQEAGVLCVYVDGKRERNAKQLTVITSQLKHYESLVRDIYPKVDLELAKFVDQALEKISNLSLSSPTVRKAPEDTESSTPTNTLVDHTVEDFNGDSSLQAIGFVGEHSATAWLYRLKLLIGQISSNTDGQFEDSPSISSCGFFVENIGIPSENDSDVCACPPQPVADELVDKYFQIAHASFPILGKENFLSQCRSFYSNSTIQPGNKWMVILNIVFAIAARHSELAGDQPPLDDTPHPVYFSRAWKLNMAEGAPLDHPNLQQTQVEGLISLYLLSIGQVNRAWRICGVAIQSAIAMGIHFRTENCTITHVSKETRYRLWWALYVLDTLLCAITGRMPRMQHEHCTTPLPVPYKEEDFWNDDVKMLILDNGVRARLMGSLLSYRPSIESNERLVNSPSQRSISHQTSPSQQVQANGSLYLLYSIDLAALMRDAIEILYSPEAGRKSRSETELDMTSLNTAADNWFACLPEDYQYTETRLNRSFIRQRTSLAFQYYSTKLVISHPALVTQTHGESYTDDIYAQMATVCTKAASQMLDLLPNEPSISWLLACSPWWAALHYLTQSIVVLITQLLTQKQLRPNERQESLERVQKGLRWLSEFSTKDRSFKRALDNFTELLSS